MDQKIITPRSFQDPLFSEDKLPDAFLSVQAGLWGYAFALLDGNTQTYVALGELRVREKHELPVPAQPLPHDALLNQLFQAFPWLRKPVGSCRVMWEGEKHTLVPNDLFQESAAREILAFTTPLEPGETIHSDSLSHMGARNVFSMPPDLSGLISKTFRVPTIVHHTSVLVTTLAQHYGATLARPALFLHVREGHGDVVIMDQANLRFLNSFPFRQAEDLVFYILFTLDQLGLKPDQTHAILTGSVQKNTPLYQQISRYIRQVNLASRHPAYTMSPALRSIPEHQYLPLLNFNACGL